MGDFKALSNFNHMLINIMGYTKYALIIHQLPDIVIRTLHEISHLIFIQHS
jgi:hypothetical protein